MTTKQFTATKVTENIPGILSVPLIKLFYAVTTALSIKYWKGHKGQYCFTMVSDESKLRFGGTLGLRGRNAAPSLLFRSGWW